MLGHDQRDGREALPGLQQLVVTSEQVGLAHALGVLRERVAPFAGAAAAEQRLDAAVEVGVQRVHEHDAGDLPRVTGGEELRVHAAQRRAGQHVREPDFGRVEQRSSVIASIVRGFGPGSPRATPAR